MRNTRPRNPASLGWTRNAWERLLARQRQWVFQQAELKQQDPDAQSTEPPVCLRWIASFDAFVEDMGHRPADLHLCRRNRKQPFGPDNCYWGVKQDLDVRGRRPRWLITHKGRTMTLKEWSIELGTPVSTLYSRAKRGATGAEILGLTDSGAAL